jgi:hypothetical protein
MKPRLQLRKLGAAAAGAVLLSAVAVVQSASAATAPVTIGLVQGMFFANPTDSGAFDPSVLSSPPAFSQQFPVIGFNPPTSVMNCSNATGVDVNSRPIGDVVPNPDGTCSVVPAMANGLQAGLGTLFNFQAVFTADLNVSSAGQLTLTVFSDDGFVLGIGAQGTNQPTRVSGSPMVNPPANSFVKGYAVLGALNQSTAPNPNDIAVNFPAAGTYPIEIDYAECCAGTVSITLAFGGTIVPPAPPAPPSTHTTAITYNGDLSSDFNDPAHLSATLQDTSVSPAVPVSNEAVTLGLGAQSCSGTTDSSGMAACTLKPNAAAGNYAVTASFAGDATFLASSASAPFVVTLEEDTLTYTGAINIANGTPGTLSGSLPEDGTTPVAGRSIVFTVGTGPTGQSCTGTTNSAGTAACTIGIAQPLGPGNITASFASDGFYRSASASANSLIYQTLASGSFAIGDESASLGSAVNFWGAQWALTNSLSGGDAPSSFKGFVDSLSVTPATCGSAWSTDTGNSSGPPAAVPSFMAVAVTGSVSQSGSVVSGTVSEIVVVSTNPGYLNDPGNPGTGTVVAILCRS